MRPSLPTLSRPAEYVPSAALAAPTKTLAPTLASLRSPGRKVTIGVPGFTFTADEVVAKPVHTGLTAPEALVLTSLNSALATAGWTADRARRLREAVLTEGFQARADRGPRITIPAHWRSYVDEWSEEDVTDLLDSGVAVIGDAADLRPEPEPAPDEGNGPTVEDVASAWAAAVLAAAGGKTTGS